MTPGGGDGGGSPPRLATAFRTWRSDHRVWCAAIGCGGLIIGTALIGIAVNRSAPGMAVGGGLLAVAGLWFIESSLRGLQRMRHLLLWSLLGVVVAVLGLVIVAVAFDRASAVGAAIGLIVGASGIPLMRNVIPATGKLMETGTFPPTRWVAAGLALSGLGFLGAFTFDLHWAFDVVPILLGFALFRIGIRPLCEASPTASMRMGSFSTTLGFLFVVAGAFASSLVLFAVGMYFLVFGLITSSVAWSILDLRPIGARWAVVIGLALGGVGYFFWPRESPEWLPMVGAGVIALLGLSFALRGEVFLVLVLVGTVFVWVLADRTDDAPLDPNPRAAERILALGDSFTSGEGSTMFFPGTNVLGEAHNECRRSSTAYPYIVASRLGMGLDFFACSGAIADELHLSRQMDERSPDDVVGELPQLDNPFDKARVRVVLVSVGGNDAGFGEIGIACVLPGSCDALREHWLVNMARIGPRLAEAYGAIKDAVAPSTTVVAIPYPLLLTEEGCGWSALNRAEHQFLSELVTVLDDRIRTSAAQAGVYFFQPGLFAFEGKKICDGDGPDDTAMNFFNLHPQEGGFLDRVNPTNWVHGTFHPKPSGHLAIADILTPWLDHLLDEVDAGRMPPNPAPDPDAVFAIRRVSLLETVLADPNDLPSTPLECGVDEVGAFATLLPLIDAEDAFSLNADAAVAVCHTLPDGSWTDEDGDVVMRTEGGIRIQPQLPDTGWTQSLIYRDATDGTWRLQIVEFCNRKPRCPSDPNAWMNQRLLAEAKTTAVPAAFVFVGAWLLGLGLRRIWGSWIPPETPVEEVPAQEE